MRDRDQFDTESTDKQGDPGKDHSSDGSSQDVVPQGGVPNSRTRSQSHDRIQSDGDAVLNQEEQVLATNSQTCDSEVANGDPPVGHPGDVGQVMVDQLNIELLIDDYSRFMFGYAYRLAGSVSDAEDLTQQTFLIAHQKLHQLRSAAAAKSWLCAILRSCWLKSIRRNQPKPVSSLEIELSEILVERNSEFDFDSQAIQNALQELPADYRLVLLMYYFEDLSYQEIAKKLNVKMGTVMSRLSRAKDRVRQRLKDKDSLLDK